MKMKTKQNRTKKKYLMISCGCLWLWQLFLNRSVRRQWLFRFDHFFGGRCWLGRRISWWRLGHFHKILRHIDGQFTMWPQIVFGRANIARRRATRAQRTAWFCAIAHRIETDWFACGAQRRRPFANGRFLTEINATVDRWWSLRCHRMIVMMMVMMDISDGMTVWVERL